MSAAVRRMSLCSEGARCSFAAEISMTHQLLNSSNRFNEYASDAFEMRILRTLSSVVLVLDTRDLARRRRVRVGAEDDDAPAGGVPTKPAREADLASVVQ